MSSSTPALRPALPDEAFKRFLRLVRRQLGVPTALVSLVGPDEQVFPGAAGLPEPWQSTRRTPLSHSFCRHVVASARPVEELLDELVARLGDGRDDDIAVLAVRGRPRQVRSSS